MNDKENKNKSKIITIPNIISVIRILFIPVFLVFLFNGQNIYSFLIFILASASDGIDGFIARHFNQESELGKILDPIADRGLLICGTIALFILGRLPLWILILVVLRDVLFLIWGWYLLKGYHIRINVIFLGKFATTCFYIGFAMLVLAWPWGYGLNIIDVSWLPGFNSDLYFFGIWPIYLGIFLNVFTCYHYIKSAWNKYKEVKNA